MARPGLGHATMWCGGMVAPPGVSQMPLCPNFDVKFKNNFLEFFEKIYFRGFSKIDKRLKTQENNGGTMENKFKPSLQHL
jgi:hypothetical protein